jgi:PAS domain S-box-containing protein
VSELLTSLLSLVFNGRITSDYLITGGVVSLIVASILIYVISLSQKLKLEKDVLQHETLEKSSKLNELNSRLLKEITERNKTEEKFKALFNNAPDAMLIADPKSGILLDANSEASRLLQRPHEEIVGLHQTELHPSRLEEHSRKNFKEHASSKTNFHLTENLVSLKDGTEIPVEILGREVIINDTKVLLGTFRNITERKETEEKIKRSLGEKEVLLHEIHHRVKNNMAIIASLIRLQSRIHNDERVNSVLLDSQNRINSMALVHECLYEESNFEKIEINDYIERLTSNLMKSLSNVDIQTVINVDDVRLSIDEVISIGLILNELITNSIKYAFDNIESPLINITYAKREGQSKLIYEDNGIGYPREVDFSNSDSLGLQIIGMLSMKLQGTLEFDSDNRNKLYLSFPSNMAQEQMNG